MHREQLGIHGAFVAMHWGHNQPTGAVPGGIDGGKDRGGGGGVAGLPSGTGTGARAPPIFIFLANCLAKMFCPISIGSGPTGNSSGGEPTAV